jgi:hypothetical protein
MFYNMFYNPVKMAAIVSNFWTACEKTVNFLLIFETNYAKTTIQLFCDAKKTFHVFLELKQCKL